MSAHLWTWRVCPGVCSLPWLLGGQSVHVHRPGVLVRGCAACPGPLVDAACTSMAVEPALACPRACGLCVRGRGAGPRVGGCDSLSL